MDGGIQVAGIVIGAALLVGGGMVRLSLKEPGVQKELSRWLLATAAIFAIPLSIGLHFHAQGMETAASLLAGTVREAVIQDVKNTRMLRAVCLVTLAYFFALHSFCSWVRDVKRDTKAP
jgi:TRAP-type C4-dicarboxylate transport system permease small subunit